MAFYMENMTVKEMCEAMKITKTVIIPLGLSEQHGYHLPLSTDTKSVTVPLKNIADKINCVIAPTINYCYSGGELPGTINVNPSICALFTCEIIRSFFQTGFKNVILMVAHGGTENTVALRNEMTMFLRLNPQFKDRNLILLLPQTFIKKESLEKIYSEDNEKDWHAGHSETSLMMYWCPELVRLSELKVDNPEVISSLRKDPDWYAKAEKNIDDYRVIPWIHQRNEIEIGVMGFPEAASREFGELLAKEMEEGMVAYFKMIEENS